MAIWDTAGQEKYRSFTRQYFRGASAVLACFDITSQASFEGAQKWVHEIQEEQLSPPPVMALVGTKSDLEPQRRVRREDAKNFAEEQRMLNLECSAKEGTQVDAVFEAVARILHGRGATSRQGQLRIGGTGSDSSSQGAGRGCC